MFFLQKQPTFSTLCCNKSFAVFLNLEIGISKDILKVDNLFHAIDYFGELHNDALHY